MYRRSIGLLFLLLFLPACGPRLDMRNAIKNVSVRDVKKHITAGYDLGGSIEHSTHDETPLHCAVKEYSKSVELTADQITILKWLFGSVKTVNVLDKEKGTPLHTAAWNGGIAAAKVLFDYHIDIHAADRSEMTALHVAAYQVDPGFCRLLLEQGANPNVQDAKGRVPIHEALLKGSRNHPEATRKIVDMLLARGANINIADGQGRTPFRYTISGSDLENYLISRGAKS